MTAVEEIHAAIVKLTALKAESTPGPWTGPATILGLKNTTIFGTPIDGGHAAYVATAHDAILIVALHRTIDAQLAILQEALDFYANSQAIGMPETEMVEYYGRTLALARAINGDQLNGVNE